MCGGRQKKPQRPQQSAKSAAASPQHRKLQEALLCTKLSQQSTKFASCSIQACTTSISHNGISTSPTLIVRTKTLGSRNSKIESNSCNSKPWLNATNRRKKKPTLPSSISYSQNPSSTPPIPEPIFWSTQQQKQQLQNPPQPFTFMSPTWKPKHRAGGTKVVRL